MNRGKAKRLAREAKELGVPKRQVKHNRRFVEQLSGYVDRKTDTYYEGKMPPVLRGFRLTEAK